MRTLSTRAATRTAVVASVTTALLGTGFLVGASPATAESPHRAAIDECLSTAGAGAALRECLRGVAPRRPPVFERTVDEPSPQSEPARRRQRAADSSRTPSDAAAPEAPAQESPAQESPAAAAPADDVGPDVWAQLRECEASGDYGLNDGSGYYGAYQFDLSTWQSIGYSGYPNEASPEVQDEAARVLQSQRGWQPWPACSRKLGLA